MEAQELSELATVLSIFVDTELDVLAKGLVELVEVILILANLGEQIHALLYDVLADNFQDLVLLQCLTRDVQREVLGVNDTLDEVEVLGDKVLTVVHNEDTANIKLDVVALLLGLEEVERSTERPDISVRIARRSKKHKCSPFGDEKNGLELKLALNGKVFDGKVVLPIIGQALVECAVFLGSDLRRVASPDRLGLVELFVFNGLLLNLFGLLLLIFFIVDFFNLRLVFRLFSCLLFILNLLNT